MARIVCGLALSHGPLLTIRPVDWDLRVQFDRVNTQLPFQLRNYTFDELAARRTAENLADQCNLEERTRRQQACHAALERLAMGFASAAADAAVIIGNDQEEMYLDDVKPALAVFSGERLENSPATPAQVARMQPGIHLAEPGHKLPEDVVYPGLPALGQHIIRETMAAGFDVAQSLRVPRHADGWTQGLPHALGFVYRQVMRDEVIPNVPVLINTFYPPNQPTAQRCYHFGRAIGRAIARWPAQSRIALVASGGLSHFVIDEDLDRRVMDAMRTGDAAMLIGMDEAYFESGTSEIKNWIVAAGVLAETTLRCDYDDYVACYRSAAGTGQGMGFMSWVE
jgi:OH-DDVA oxygenase